MTRDTTTALTLAERAGRIDVGAELRVVAGPDRGRRAELSLEPLLIGSARDADLVLADATVSAHHAEVRAAGDGFELRDLGSKNGVALGTWRVERALLSEGMRLRLGATELEVARAGAPRWIELAPAGVRPGGLVAHSVPMRALVRRLEAAALSDAPVLIEGEPGTGKEVVAEALHHLGPRAGGPLVVCDCAALGRTLAASELFGHEAGAFSGAVARAGLLEEADGGTLLLDGVHLLPLELQPLLLTALDRSAARRVGGASDFAFDTRVVATSGVRLAGEAAAGRFRDDLLHRLAVLVLRVPPLRERRDDVPHLARAFAAELGVPLEPALLALLQAHDWPGNARELRGAVMRLAARRSPIDGHASGAVDPLRDGERLRPLSEARRLAGDRFERGYLEAVLAAGSGSVSRAAELAGVSRQALTALVARHGLRARDRR